MKNINRNIGVAMLGARMHYAVPAILHAAGRLERFYTDSFRRTNAERVLFGKLERLEATPKLVKMFAGRYTEDLAGADVVRFEALGIRNALQRRRVHSRSEKELVNDAMAKAFGARALGAGAGAHDMLYAFKGAALEIFEGAGPKTIKILEQSILPYDPTTRLLGTEQEQWGDWYRKPAEFQFLERTVDREKREWALADLIVTASEFVRQGLLECGVPDRKIAVVPYGIPLPEIAPPRERVGPLRILFAGMVGLRKGAHHLLRSLEEFAPEDVQAVFAGDCELSPDVQERYKTRATFLGRVPRAQMTSLYRDSDVFVLPSIVEGSATVTYEAMATGLPIITTANAGSLVIDGVNGQVVPVGDALAIAEAIRTYMNNETIWSSHASEALKMRHEVSREAYGERLMTVLEDFEPNRQG